MKAYKTKVKKLKGTDFHEVRKKAFGLYTQIKRRTKRRPYIRSAYFKKDKIFLALFWQHLFDKQKWQDRMRRLKYFEVGLELIRHSKFEPKSKDNPNKPDEILHRFTGITKENEVFYVQIKNISYQSSQTNKEKNLPLSVVYKLRAESFFHLHNSKNTTKINPFYKKTIKIHPFAQPIFDDGPARAGFYHRQTSDTRQPLYAINKT